MKPIRPVLLCTAFLASSCDRPAGTQDWLRGNTLQKFDAVARHLRGFDLAMVEVGYRYNELYFAGEDGNWEYAAYHLEKIRAAIENGIERRPNRAQSSRALFLEGPLPRIKAAVNARDKNLFRARYNELREACARCHEQEKVPFVSMGVPSRRIMPFRNGESDR